MSKTGDRRILGGFAAGEFGGGHQGVDLLFALLDYLVQVIGIFTTQSVAVSGQAQEVKAGIMMLLLSAALFAAESAAGAFYDGALSAERGAPVRLAFWGTAVAAAVDVVFFVCCTCLVLPDVLFTVAWLACMATGVVAPTFFLRYRFDRFLGQYDGTNVVGRGQGREETDEA